MRKIIMTIFSLIYPANAFCAPLAASFSREFDYAGYLIILTLLLLFFVYFIIARLRNS